MTYDLHGGWDKTTGHNANLYRYETNVAAADSNDVATAINYWLDNGAPKEKLIMGLPLYGRSFSLTNQADTSVGAPSSGAGIAGQYSYENGMIGLNEVRKTFNVSFFKVIEERKGRKYLILRSGSQNTSGVHYSITKSRLRVVFKLEYKLLYFENSKKNSLFSKMYLVLESSGDFF